MDIYWMTAGGADPVAYLKEYPSRFRSLHIKDMTKRMRFSGDGSDAGQWIGLFPNISDAGSGVLDLPAILTQAKKSGAQHFFVERDLAPNPDETLRKSFQYLSAL
jgi:sugar phosphate isomerase/epimerase